MTQRTPKRPKCPKSCPISTTILTFALASLVLIVTPGPDMALQLSRAINYGRAHGVVTVLGTLAGVLVHTALVAFGISLLIIAAPPAFLALKIAGAVYLLWLAWQAIRSGGGLQGGRRGAEAPDADRKASCRASGSIC